MFDINFTEYTNFEHYLQTSTNIPCRYYYLVDIKHNTDDCSFSVMHMNIRSLIKHDDKLITLLMCTDHSFDIIGCSETWVHEQTFIDFYKINGYSAHFKNRLGRTGGGVCLYVKSIQ